MKYEKNLRPAKHRWPTSAAGHAEKALGSVYHSHDKSRNPPQ